MYPGPTFEARRGRPIAVRWRNQLPTNHILQVAPTIHGAEPPIPEVRTVVHVHGLKVLPQSDGIPKRGLPTGLPRLGRHSNGRSTIILMTRRRRGCGITITRSGSRG